MDLAENVSAYFIFISVNFIVLDQGKINDIMSYIILI